MTLYAVVPLENEKQWKGDRDEDQRGWLGMGMTTAGIGWSKTVLCTNYQADCQIQKCNQFTLCICSNVPCTRKSKPKCSCCVFCADDVVACCCSDILL